MSCMKRDVLSEASVQYVESSSVISSTHTLKVKLSHCEECLWPLLDQHRQDMVYCVLMQDFCVSKVTVSELEFVGAFQLSIYRDALCHVRLFNIPPVLEHFLKQAIVGFFEAGFLGPQHTEYLKTGPQDTPTHWKQTVLYLPDPIPVHMGMRNGIKALPYCVYICMYVGDVLEGTMSVSRSKQDPRALDLDLSFIISSVSYSDIDNHKYSGKYKLR